MQKLRRLRLLWKLLQDPQTQHQTFLWQNQRARLVTQLFTEIASFVFLFPCVCVCMWTCCPSSQQSGQSPAFCGRSGKQLKKHHSNQRGMLIDDWSRAVKSLNVSSSVNQASRLIDCSDQCWQSSGSQGKARDWIAYSNKLDDNLFSLALLKRNASSDRMCHSRLCSTGFVSSSSLTFSCTGWRWWWTRQTAATCPHWWWCQVG